MMQRIAKSCPRLRFYPVCSRIRTCVFREKGVELILMTSRLVYKTNYVITQDITTSLGFKTFQ